VQISLAKVPNNLGNQLNDPTNIMWITPRLTPRIILRHTAAQIHDGEEQAIRDSKD
jgi:hypothetical protein